LIAVVGDEPVPRALTAERCHLDVMVPRAARTTIRNVNDRWCGRDAAICPVLRGAILKIINLANLDRLRRT
jgi:hypothetical protein